MDSLAEKKWFVYLGDHHEGPFSVDDIQGKISEGHVSTENYVWAEGMTDWKVMVELDAFHRLMESSPLPKVSQASFNIEGEVAPLELQLELRNPQVDEKQLKDATADEVKQPEKIETSPSGAKNPLQASLIRIAKVSSGFVILAGFLTAYLQGHLDPLVHSSAVQGSLQSLSYLVRPHLLALSEKFPYLEQWVSPIPAIEDVSAEEYDELKNAAQGKPETHGVRLSIALSSLDSLSPSFYVSTNLPSGAQFVIFVVGVPETLLNQLSFSTHVPVTVTKHLGKTQAIRSSDGKPLPKGEYNVYLLPHENITPEIKNLLISVQSALVIAGNNVKIPPELPKGIKVLSFKNYFLGGARDATYTHRLKEFHDKFREKTRSELVEARQFAATLKNQLDSTITTFSSIRKGKITSRQRNQWEGFHAQWLSLQRGLDQEFIKWTPEYLQKQIFYGVIYQQIQQFGQDIAKVHGYQHSYFVGSHDLKTFDIQFGEALSSAQSTLVQLLSKIDQAEKIPPSPNGMPRKEGL